MVKFAGIVLVSLGLFIIAFIVLLWWSIRTTPEELKSLNVEYTGDTIVNSSKTEPTPIPDSQNQSINIQASSEPPAMTGNLLLPSDNDPIVKDKQVTVENFSELLEGYGNNTLLKNIAPKSWSDPDWLSVDQYKNEETLQNSNIQLIKKSAITSELISGLPEIIEIPILGLTAPVENLEIIEKDGRKEYETPKNIVGRIPHSLEEPDSFMGWYFGHLESPIKGEGNVFHDLPKIASHLTDGDKVLIYLQKSGKKLAYQAIKSETVHESDLKLFDPGYENIILVTCSNRPLYDHRQLVTANLVGLVE